MINLNIPEVDYNNLAKSVEDMSNCIKELVRLLNINEEILLTEERAKEIFVEK